MFKKGDRCVKILHGGGTRTATIGWIVAMVKNGAAVIKDARGHSVSHCFDVKTGREIAPMVPGFYAEIIAMDGDDHDDG